MNRKSYSNSNRVFSSISQGKNSSITPQKSLSKLKERLRLTHGFFGPGSQKERVKQEYLIENNKPLKKPKIKAIEMQKRRKQSLIRLNCDIRFQKQLKEEIYQLSQTLKRCQNLQRQQLITYENFVNRSIKSNEKSNISFIGQNFFLPKNIVELVHLQQRINNRDEQIASITQEIAQLKQQNWYSSDKMNKKPLQQIKNSEINNSCIGYSDEEKFLLAQQVKSLNQQLRQTIKTYQAKAKELKYMRLKVNSAYQDSQTAYRHKVHSQQNSKSLSIEKSVTYAQFKQYFMTKKSQSTQRQPSSNVAKSNKPTELMIPSMTQFSNISNVSALIPTNFFNQWLNRSLLPGEIPQLPKEKHPTMKSMNFKKKVLKQAIQTQKNKHDKQMTDFVDKLLFLHDQDVFLSEEIDDLLGDISGLEIKFSEIGMKTRQPSVMSNKAPMTKRFVTKRRPTQEESSIQYVPLNHNKNKSYIEENLLLDNTGLNSNFLDQTEKTSSDVIGLKCQ